MKVESMCIADVAFQPIDGGAALVICDIEADNKQQAAEAAKAIAVMRGYTLSRYGRPQVTVKSQSGVAQRLAEQRANDTPSNRRHHANNQHIQNSLGRSERAQR